MADETPTVGCRNRDGSMWLECYPEPDRKPGIAICTFAGNWINPPVHQLIAVFESKADRDLVLRLHSEYMQSNSPTTGANP